MIDWTMLSLGIVAFVLAAFNYFFSRFSHDAGYSKVLKKSGVVTLGIGIIFVILAFFADK